MCIMHSIFIIHIGSIFVWCVILTLASYGTGIPSNRYEGEWKDDMKWGFGKAVYRKKAHYEGHFFMDKRHGFGRMWYANAGTYEVRSSVLCYSSSRAGFCFVKEV